MKIYFIYKYEWEDGSIYIGQSHTGSNRYGNINEYKSSPRVYNKMRKFPEFEKEILIANLSENEVDDFEKYYIKVYNSYKHDNPKYGLNLTRGGQGVHGLKHSKESKEKMREHSAMKNPYFVSQRTGENSVLYGKTGEQHPMYGVKLSEETKKKMSDARKSSLNGRSKKVYQYTLDGKFLKSFDCCSDADKELNLYKGSVKNAANPNCKQKSAGGFLWRFYYEEQL